MSLETINVTLPDQLLHSVEALARRENVSLEEFIRMTLSEKVIEVDEHQYLQMRKAKFRAAMAKVGSEPVSEEDRI